MQISSMFNTKFIVFHTQYLDSLDARHPAVHLFKPAAAVEWVEVLNVIVGPGGVSHVGVAGIVPHVVRNVGVRAPAVRQTREGVACGLAALRRLDRQALSQRYLWKSRYGSCVSYRGRGRPAQQQSVRDLPGNQVAVFVIVFVFSHGGVKPSTMQVVTFCPGASYGVKGISRALGKM